MILAGVFVTDAGAGFPPGAPAGAPKLSWHGALHEVGYLVALVSWTAACFVFRGRFATLGQRALGGGVGPERASRPWRRSSCSADGPTGTASASAS